MQNDPHDEISKKESSAYLASVAIDQKRIFIQQEE
jgi:hypothetical protein